MAILPPPPSFIDSGAVDCSPDEAAAAVRHDDAAVDFDCIHEIFAGAKRLDDLDGQFLFKLDAGNDKYRGMRKPRLDVVAFMTEIEQAPLFLRRAG